MHTFIHYSGSHINVHILSNIRLNYALSYPMGATYKVVAISAEVISWTPYSWVAMWETLGSWIAWVGRSRTCGMSHNARLYSRAFLFRP